MIANKEKILSIANEVRKWAEQYAKSHGFPASLRGICAIASAELHKRLKAENIDTILHMSEKMSSEYCKKCHVFLTVEGYILDVTATQFSRETFYRVRNEVILTSRKDVYKYWFWQGVDEFNSITDLINHQQQENWYPNQVARA